MKHLINILLICLFTLAACTAPLNIVETKPVYKGDTAALHGIVYALPQTSFKLNLEVTRTRTIRGPYYRFAEKLLSLKDVPSRNSDVYNISRVQLEPFEEADPEHVYLVRQVSGQTDLSGLLKLGREGLIFDNRQTTPAGDQINFSDAAGEGPFFTELSMEKNMVMSIDTFYKTILTDTSFIRVPVLKEQLIVKTIDEKAEEAADFILELRYERFMMLTGNNSLVPENAVERLDEIEREYLELFIGKTFEEKYSYSFYITPSKDEVYENIEILEFSDRRGILEQGSSDSDVLSLSLRKTGKTEILKTPGQAIKLPLQRNALYYRVPDVANVELSLGGRTLLKDRCMVSQYGEILSIPTNPAD